MKKTLFFVVVVVVVVVFNYSKYKCLGLKPQKTHIDNKYGTPLWLKLKPMPSPPDQKNLSLLGPQIGIHNVDSFVLETLRASGHSFQQQ